MSGRGTGGWHPIAASDDLPYRHAFQGELFGRELVAWRADDDFVNVWENRCLHRGVRLSIGTNLGSALRCQYHGWRYANRSAGCTYIPAHPADAPARTICNRTYRAVERHGLVWTSLAGEGEPPAIPDLAGKETLCLRAVAVNAPPEAVIDALAGSDGETLGRCERVDDHAVLAHRGDERVVLLVQPVDTGRAVIRGVLVEAPGEAAQIAALRRHDARLCALRDAVEARAARSPAPASLRTDPTPAQMPEVVEKPGSSGRHAPLRVVVSRKVPVARDVTSFRLEPVRGTLPAFQPGAHVDVHLPNGLVRQYSITNGPDETRAYVLGVKRELASRGGSACLHDAVAEGDVLAISEPHNNFPLRRDATHTLLLAGGIGLTPLLAMARALRADALPFTLHHFARDAEHAPFADAVGALGEVAQVHLGLDAQATGERVEALLAGYTLHHHVYVCGPGPMIATARATAERLGWPEAAVHYEHFANEQPIETDSSFEIALARSGLTLQVPAGRSIVEVLRENGVAIETSCEQGACGTCRVTVIDGDPLHQDVYLGASERESGSVLMACVSRARSARLVLDL